MNSTVVIVAVALDLTLTAAIVVPLLVLRSRRRDAAAGQAGAAQTWTVQPSTTKSGATRSGVNQSGTNQGDLIAEAIRAGFATSGQTGSPFDATSTVVVNGQQLDARQYPGLQEEIQRLVADGWRDPEALKSAVQDTLRAHGVQTSPGMPGASAAATADPVERLRKLDELRRYSMIDESEYQRQRQRILDSL